MAGDETLETNVRLTATDESGNAMQAFAKKLQDVQATANQAIMGGMVTPTQQATAATEELKRKTEDNVGRAVTDSWKKASESALAFMAGMTGVGFGLAEAGRFAKESIAAKFADFEEGMLRIQQATAARAAVEGLRDMIAMAIVAQKVR